MNQIRENASVMILRDYLRNESLDLGKGMQHKIRALNYLTYEQGYEVGEALEAIANVMGCNKN